MMFLIFKYLVSAILVDCRWKLHFQALAVFRSINVITCFPIAASKYCQLSHSFTCDISTHIAAMPFFCSSVLLSLILLAVLFVVITVTVAIAIAIAVGVSVLVAVALAAAVGAVEYH